MTLLSHQRIIHCPACGGRDVRRSKARGLLDALMGKFDRLPLRCRGCGKRFYRALTEERTDEAVSPQGRGPADA